MANSRSNLRKTAAYLSYVPTLGFSAFFSLARIVVYAHVLGAEAFGLLARLLLVSSLFCVVGSLGFQLLAQRELPALFSSGKYRTGLIFLCKAMIVTTFTASLMSAYSLLNFSIAGVSGLLLCCAIAHGWSQQIFMLVLIDTRSRLEMTRYAKQSLLKTVSAFLTAMVVAMFGAGVTGIVIAEIFVTLLFGLTLISKVTKNSAKLLLWKASIRGFTRVAFLSTNIDRWLAAEYLTDDDFGQYAFAWISLTAALSIQSLLNAGIFPLISRKIKEENDTAAFKITAYSSLTMLFIGITISIALSLLSKWFIFNKYQHYAPALPLITPLLLASIFRLSDFWSSYLIAIHRQQSLIKAQVFLFFIALIYYLEIIKSTHISPISFAWMAVTLAVISYGTSAAIAFYAKKYS